MTIHNPDLFVAGIWDWGFLDSCFTPTRIRITDLDGFVERNAKFLILETKAKDAQIPTGQMILFRKFVNCGNSVLVIWGHQSDETHDLLLMAPEGESRHRAASKEVIWGIVRDWYRWADNQGPFTPDTLRPFLDRPLTAVELEEAFVHIRKFNVSVIQGIVGNGRFNLSVVSTDDESSHE